MEKFLIKKRKTTEDTRTVPGKIKLSGLPHNGIGVRGQSKISQQIRKLIPQGLGASEKKK